MATLSFLGICFIISVFLFVFAVKSFCKRTKISRSLGHTFVLCGLILIAYISNYMVPTVEAKEIVCSIEYILVIWTLFFMSEFVFEADDRRFFKLKSRVTAGIAAIDTVVLATNFYNNFAYDYMEIHRGDYYYLQAVPKALFYFHLFVCTFMLCAMIYSNLRAALATPKYYRSRYYLLQLVLIVLTIWNPMIASWGRPLFEYSRALYGPAAVALYLLTYHYSPVALLRSLQKLIDDNLTDAIVMYDIHGQALKYNSKATSLYDMSILSSEECLRNSLYAKVSEGRTVQRIAGRIYELLYMPVYDKRKEYEGAAYIFYDVTENRKQLEREHNAATFDKLTDCYNRLGFIEHAPAFLEENKVQGKYAVVVSGICDFKGINALYGTQSGDKVLKEISSKFYEFHHQYPMLYGRTAEGKFTSLIPFEYVDELVKGLSRLSVPIGEDVYIHVDICHGFVVMQDMAKPIESYYELSLLALARCKTSMASSVLEYSSEMADDQMRKQLLLSETHDAIENKEFFIEYQPQINLSDNTVCGAEALVRWNHPTLGRISPAEFIPLFESNGFITKLDIFVWNEAAETIRRLTDSNVYNGPISVNVSQIDIMCMDVAAEFEKIVAKHEIEPARLHVEITESACVNNRDILIETINKLRSSGFFVEIDDFGSGYSSLNALMHIPFDAVKLDMMFMRNLNDEKSDVILSAMAGMIHDLKAEIIVEGVETEANASNAMHINGDVAQGYLYSKPICLEKFIDFVKKY